MNIWQTARFDHTFKKLHSSSQAVVLQAIRRLAMNPSLGEQKNGDLGEFRVYKFRERQQLWLLAYRWNGENSIQLVDLGSHENFYRSLKKLRGLTTKNQIITDGL